MMFEDVTTENPGVDLDQFHFINKDGKATGVFDNAIFEYIKQAYDIKILGKVPLIYRGGVFIQDLSGAELQTMIRKLIYPKFRRYPTIKRIYDLFISASELQVTAGDLNQFPPEWVAFKNGFFDPVSWEIIPHDPKYLTIYQIPHEFFPDRPKPQSKYVKPWLNSIFDAESKEAWLEYNGYCATRDTRQQKFMILVGEGGTGKSTAIQLNAEVVGAENISNISLSELTQRFSAYGLLGKLVNSCADLEVKALEDTSKLKQIVGEDTIRAEAKGKDAISFRSFAKLMFSTNQLPIVKSEQTNGFYRRLLILPMDKAPERVDTDFFSKLKSEIDFYIYECMEALHRMYERGQIIDPKSSIEAVKRLRCESDTVEAFIHDMCSVVTDSPTNRTDKPKLFEYYETYCRDLGRQSLSKNNFYKAMMLKGFSIVKTGGNEKFKGILYPKSSLNPSLFLPVEESDRDNPFEVDV